jgi:hypothetical protein
MIDHKTDAKIHYEDEGTIIEAIARAATLLHAGPGGLRLGSGPGPAAGRAALIAIKPGRPRLIYRAHESLSHGKDMRKGFT